MSSVRLDILPECQRFPGLIFDKVVPVWWIFQAVSFSENVIYCPARFYHNKVAFASPHLEGRFRSERQRTIEYTADGLGWYSRETAPKNIRSLGGSLP